MNAQRRARASAVAPARPSAGLHLAGAPHRLTALTALRPAVAEWATVSLQGLDLESPLLAVVTASGQIKLRLPPTTPPGTYEGAIAVGGQERPISVEVLPHTSLQVQPDGVTLTAAPGAQLSAVTTIFNQGNVAAEIKPAYPVGFVDVHALDHGLDEAARPALRDGQRRVDALFDALAQGSGGAARLEVAEGVGRLEPGEARALRARFTVPRELRPGHTYTARWKVDDASFSLRVDVPAGTTDKKGPA